MRNAKAIEGFIDACLETARKMGFQQSELDKLLNVLVVTRADLSAASSLRNYPITFPSLGYSVRSEGGPEGVIPKGVGN